MTARRLVSLSMRTAPLPYNDLTRAHGPYFKNEFDMNNLSCSRVVTELKHSCLQGLVHHAALLFSPVRSSYLRRNPVLPGCRWHSPS